MYTIVRIASTNAGRTPGYFLDWYRGHQYASNTHSRAFNMVHQQRLVDREDTETPRRLATATNHVELVAIVLKESRKARRTKHAIAFGILHLGHQDHDSVVAETATISFRIFCNKSAGLRNRLINANQLSAAKLLVSKMVAGRHR